MARSFWKGKVLLPPIYTELDSNSLNYKNIWLFKSNIENPIYSTIKLYRRFQFLSSKLLNLNLKYKVYNGYDFFIKKPDISILGLNLSNLVLTRESRVVHKAKLSKEAKRNQQAKLKKKVASKKK